MNSEKKKLQLKAYSKVWKIENRIYAIQNIILPVPIAPREILYFFVIATIFFILSKIIPFLSAVPVMLRYLLLPIVFTKFLLKKKLDGKMPHKYFVAWIKYILDNRYIERFKKYSTDKEKIKLEWYCSRGL